MKHPELFTCLEYRKFLQDAFISAKARNPKHSYRSFAQEAGYTSPNFLQLVIAGKRDLSQANLAGTIRALGLNRQEADFFTNLVGFNQAEGFEEKNFYYQRMTRSRKYGAVKPVEKGQFDYFDQWYHPVVRELLLHPDFDGNASWIAERVHPRISPAQAEKSMELLQSLGLIRLEDGTGKWIQVDAVLSTPPEVASLAVANYHRSVLRLASESIEAFPSTERDLRAVTMGIPKSAFPELKRRMEEFWRDLLALGDGRAGVEEVVQINLQLFPMTKGTGEKNAK